MNDLTKRLAALTPNQLALLNQRIKGSQAKEAQIPTPGRRPRNGEPPLSFAQERMWFLDQIQPNNPAYNLSLTFPLQGAANASAVERTLNEIIRRHEALRTHFVVREGRPVQAISPELEIKLAVHDVRSLPEQPRQFEAATRIHEGSLRPFDIASAPLIRALLVHYTDTEHLLLVCMHHIVSDGWSLGVFMDEFNYFYRGFSQGAGVSLPELPFQYADFAIWQRELLSGEFAESLLKYWRRQLAGAPESLNLPTDYPLPTVRSFHGAAQYRLLDGATVASLKHLARSESVTLFMELLAGFYALLHRYTGQNDLVVGSPVANRNHKELEPLIGFFVNTLVLRAQLPPRCTFRELLGRVRDVTINAQAHQELPFERLVAELLSVRDPSRNPLFQVMFGFQNASGPAGMEKLQNNPVRGMAGDQPMPPVSTFVKFDLTLTVLDFNTDMLALWEYRGDLFDHETIARMAQHFETLLRSAVAEPDRALADLPMLDSTERHLQLVSWNGPQLDGEPRCLHELFEQQAERTPNEVALVCQERELTFSELKRRVDDLARRLRALGVTAETRVGVCVTRSIEMVLGLLAVLKAGGAYVPLDPLYPKARLALMVEDAAPKVILTQERLLPLVDEVAAETVARLCLDKLPEVQSDTPPSEPGRAAEPDNAAYVIYTSGSTGRPKGVVVSHRAIVSHMRWVVFAWPLDTSDRVLQRTPFSFDASVWEIFAPLMSGARLVLSAHDATNYSLIPDEIVRHGVTVLQAVPSLLRVLLEDTGLGRCQSLRRVYCGGEALSSQTVDLFHKQQKAELFNLYGPTEAVVDCAWWKCSAGHARPTAPIGRPIANTQIYIVNGDMRLVPAGVTGELYIGGEGVARGYLGRPDLTAEAFVPSPFSDVPGARLYRTGDLARRLPDGSMEYVGRSDHQVKVRGFRIELSAVEAALLSHPEVETALVMAQDDGLGGRRLVAYFTTFGEEPPNASALRRFLGESLPDHAIPSAFVPLKELPLLPNGKINRAAVEQLGLGGPALREDFVAPRNEVESRLAEIWQSVLKIERVSINDNFFALGGHSLLASQVAARLRDAFGMDFQLSKVFESPTISLLAEAVQQERGGSPSDAADPAASSEVMQRRLLDNIDNLSEEEIDALLLAYQKKPAV